MINLKTKTQDKEIVAKYVTIDELEEINELSLRLGYNRTFNIKRMIKDGHLSTARKDFAYPIQECMLHENSDGSLCQRVYLETFSMERYLLDMPIEVFENLREQSFIIKED